MSDNKTPGVFKPFDVNPGLRSRPIPWDLHKPEEASEKIKIVNITKPDMYFRNRPGTPEFFSALRNAAVSGWLEEMTERHGEIVSCETMPVKGKHTHSVGEPAQDHSQGNVAERVRQLSEYACL